MDIQKLMNILSIAGAVAIALPPVLTAIIAVAMAIPGAQPEKFLQETVQPKLQGLVDFVTKFSKK